MTDWRQAPWDAIPLVALPGDKIAPNFSIRELTRSETADRNLIDNAFPDQPTLAAAVYLCREVMQKVRDRFGPFSPNSVYRSQALERALKRKPESWTSKSQHTLGQACDIEVAGVSNLALARWIEAELSFDQLILECYNPAKGPGSGWVHVSLVPPGGRENRGEVLSYIFDPAAGKYVYVHGLHESVS